MPTDLRITHLPVEVVYDATADLRVAQVVVEVLHTPILICTPDPATMTLTGYAPAVLLGIALSVPAGSVTLVGFAPTAWQTVLHVPSPGTLTLTGQAPTLAHTIGVPAGTLTVTGLPPGPAVFLVVTPDTGTVTLTGQVPGSVVGTVPPAGSLVWTGAAPTVASTIHVPAGALVLTGSIPALSAPAFITVPAGTLTLTGLYGTRTVSLTVPMGTGTLTVAGVTPTVLVTPPDPDPVAATTWPVRRLRRAPFVAGEGRWMFHTTFELLLEAGVGLVEGDDPKLMVRWSDNGGRTWSHDHWTSAGALGQYRRRAVWRRLGRSRSRLYEVSMTAPVKAAWIMAVVELDGGS